MDTALLGTSVPLPQLGRELKKLWESAAGEKSRASLVNFAVYCEGEAAMAANTELIANFTREYSCRAILMMRDRAAKTPQVEAWVNAHCHLPRAGAKAVCCEQITFRIQGASNQLLSNVLFANLDSDLPLYLWWQGEFMEPIDDFLWTWVDRLIFDSRDWQDPTAQFALLGQACQSAKARVILCDLNWTRTLHLRQALAQMFDRPDTQAQLSKVQSLKLTHAPGHVTTAKLFAAWVAAQLGWTLGERQGNGVTFHAPGGAAIQCRFAEAPGASVSGVELVGEKLQVRLRREGVSPFYHAELALPDGSTVSHLLPAGQESMQSLLDEELTLGGRHKVYLKALSTAKALL